MLVLGRREGDTIRIGKEITVTVTKIKGSIVKIGIQAPEGTKIYRSARYSNSNSMRSRTMGKTKLADKVKSIPQQPAKAKPPWDGPESNSDQGGVTQSLLGRFLSDRERFRVKVIEGWALKDSFEAKMEFGNMWHVCEEALAKGEDPSNKVDQWKPLNDYVKELFDKYRMQRDLIQHWSGICKALFPLYVEYWRGHQDVKDRTPLLQEQVFKVPYKLPSGRTVYLRGKWDAVDLIGKGKAAAVYVQENKTKSSINVVELSTHLKFDLQSMFYLVALGTPKTGDSAAGRDVKGWPYGAEIKGVRYNVIRRSAHKSVESMLKKIEDDRADNRMGEWFSRFLVDVTPGDILRFRRESLDPILEQLCDWYSCMVGWNNPFDYAEPNLQVKTSNAIHWRTPYYYDPISQGGSGDLDAYLDSGSTVGLERLSTLFPELL